MKKDNFRTLFIFFLSFTWFYTFSYSTLPLHILTQGLTFSDQILGQIIRFVSELLVLFTIVSLTAKLSFRIAMIFIMAYIILSIKIISPFQFYIGSALNGMAVFFFYVFYNTAHFENTSVKNIGTSSALMYSFPAIISIVAPLASGTIKAIMPPLIWIFSLIFFIYSFSLVSKQQDFRITYSIRKSISEIKQTRLFILLEGIWESLVFGIIPIYSLFFIKSPLNYGIYLSYLSLLGAVSNLIFGKLTDKIRKRSLFLYPITIILAVTTILFTTATSNIKIWFLVTGLIQFMLPLFWNITTSLVIDTRINLRQAIPGREIYLAVGKTIGMSLVFLSFLIEKTPNLLFWLLGLIMLLIPINLYYQTTIKKSYKFF